MDTSARTSTLDGHPRSLASGKLRRCGLLVAVILTMASAAAPEAVARIATLTLDPSSPACEDVITVSVGGGWSDGCWQLTGVELVTEGSTFWFVIHAIDHRRPGVGCVGVPAARSNA